MASLDGVCAPGQLADHVASTYSKHVPSFISSCGLSLSGQLRSHQRAAYAAVDSAADRPSRRAERQAQTAITRIKAFQEENAALAPAISSLERVPVRPVRSPPLLSVESLSLAIVDLACANERLAIANARIRQKIQTTRAEAEDAQQEIEMLWSSLEAVRNHNRALFNDLAGEAPQGRQPPIAEVEPPAAYASFMAADSAMRSLVDSLRSDLRSLSSVYWHHCQWVADVGRVDSLNGVAAALADKIANNAAAANRRAIVHRTAAHYRSIFGTDKSVDYLALASPRLFVDRLVHTLA